MSTRIDRKAIRRAHKDNYRPMGVYRILSSRDGRMFVGASVNLPAIFNSLRMQLRSNSYLKHPKLQRAWNALGKPRQRRRIGERLTCPPWLSQSL